MTYRASEREVVVAMTDMAQFSQLSAGMTPEEIRDFLIRYHSIIFDIISQQESQPVEVEPSAGDGSLIIFDKRPGEDRRGVCTRAVQAALRMAEAISAGTLVPTRMGLFLGTMTEALIGTKMAKFGSCFSIANRIEGLCGYFGTHFLMDREVAKNQQEEQRRLVDVAKVTLASVPHPLRLYTVYRRGIQGIPQNTDDNELQGLVRRKNQAMGCFSGNRRAQREPDFPRAREELLEVQRRFERVVGHPDLGTECILEYIREHPFPEPRFRARGMKLGEGKQDISKARLCHMSCGLLRAINPGYYRALVEDTTWEQYFQLEWIKKGTTIIEIGSLPDGVYYLENGVAEIYNEDAMPVATLEAGAIFGELAYFGKERKRTATVKAKTDLVLRKISTDDFEKLPVIMLIFEEIARRRLTLVAADCHEQS
ncbi:cyclic nucleotide-binding domain-containing protein [Desulforhopalus singaporensis]|nr:cyclic nucleotide-binding domain-containing protein [Desulforhopalus singaporensis]